MKIPFDSFSFIFGALFGSGSVWQFLQHRLKSKEAELKKYEAINSIRGQLFELMKKLKETQSYYADLRDGKIKIDGLVKNVLNQLGTEIDLIYSDILVKEDQLSKLEGREPRVIHKCHGGRPAKPASSGLI